MRWFPVAFLTSGLFIMTRAGLASILRVMSPHVEPLHHGITYCRKRASNTGPYSCHVNYRGGGGILRSK